jgi:hypothetical protein
MQRPQTARSDLEAPQPLFFCSCLAFEHTPPRIFQVLNQLAAAHGGSLGPEAQAALARALRSTPLLRALPPAPRYLAQLLKGLVDQPGSGAGGGASGGVLDELAELCTEVLLRPPVRRRCGCSWIAATAPTCAPALLRSRTTGAATAASGGLGALCRKMTCNTLHSASCAPA